MREIFTALLEQRLEESLSNVEDVISSWRAKEASVFEAHAQLLKHAARAEGLLEKLLEGGDDVSAALMREAFDSDLVPRDEFEELVGRAPEEVESLCDVDEDILEAPSKRKVLDEFLGDGPALLQLDANCPGVDVPERYQSDSRLVLRLGHGLTPPITDMCIDDDGVTVTLTFQGQPYHCTLPWQSVYAIVSAHDQRRMVWPDDVPKKTITLAPEPQTEPLMPPPPMPAKKRVGGHLRLVE